MYPNGRISKATSKHFKVSVTMDNAAFEDGRQELARILCDLAERVENGADVYHLQDINGNTVGSAKFALR